MELRDRLIEIKDQLKDGNRYSSEEVEELIPENNELPLLTASRVIVRLLKDKKYSKDSLLVISLNLAISNHLKQAA